MAGKLSDPVILGWCICGATVEKATPNALPSPCFVACECGALLSVSEKGVAVRAYPYTPLALRLGARGRR